MNDGERPALQSILRRVIEGCANGDLRSSDFEELFGLFARPDAGALVANPDTDASVAEVCGLRSPGNVLWATWFGR